MEKKKNAKELLNKYLIIFMWDYQQQKNYYLYVIGDTSICKIYIIKFLSYLPSLN